MTIKELRELTNMTQKEFGEYLKIPFRTIQNWETGHRTPPEYVAELIEYKIKKENNNMKKEEITLEELRNTKDWDHAVVVFTKDSFKKEFSEKSRSYMVNSKQKYFQDGMISNSLFANCLDGTDGGVRLDWYFGEWKVEYCYIV